PRPAARRPSAEPPTRATRGLGLSEGPSSYGDDLDLNSAPPRRACGDAVWKNHHRITTARGCETPRMRRPGPAATMARHAREPRGTEDKVTSRIAINGFGRVGRTTLRAAFERDLDVEWVAINDLADARTLAHLLKHDSVYGPFPAAVEAHEGAIRIDGVDIPVLRER